MIANIAEKLNNFFTFTFARFFAGFYCYATVEIDARM